MGIFGSGLSCKLLALGFCNLVCKVFVIWFARIVILSCSYSDAMKKKFQWVMKMYCEWRELANFRVKKTGSPLILKELRDMTNEELCAVLGHFLMEICKQSGEEYPRETVYEILMCIQGQLSTEGRYS